MKQQDAAVIIICVETFISLVGGGVGACVCACVVGAGVGMRLGLCYSVEFVF